MPEDSQNTESSKDHVRSFLGEQNRLFNAPQAEIRNDSVWISQWRVDDFVTWVAQGNQKQAEAALKASPGLALAKGHAKALCGREFPSISGIQFAQWAFDYPMLKMIKAEMQKAGYDQELKAQLDEQAAVTVAAGHGESYDPNHLLDALKTYLDNYDTWQREESLQRMKDCWVNKVGKAQGSTLAHIAQFYSQEKCFEPSPNLDNETFKREIRDGWYTRLGKKYGAAVGTGPVGVCFQIAASRVNAAIDHREITRYVAHRQAQCAEIMLELASNLSESRPLPG